MLQLYSRLPVGVALLVTMIFVWLATPLPLVAGPEPRPELISHLEAIAKRSQFSPMVTVADQRSPTVGLRCAK
jgi:hypothetical protein